MRLRSAASMANGLRQLELGDSMTSTTVNPDGKCKLAVICR